jgi:uncharacterized protein YjbI with pentapeptide repeats
MDEYLFNFVMDEVRLQMRQEPREVAKWQKTFCELIGFMMKHGMPMELLSPRPDFQEENRQACNAEDSLLAVLGSFQRITKIVSEIKFPTLQTFGALLARLQGQRIGRANPMSFHCLSYLDLSHCIFHMRDFYNGDFRQANLQFSEFHYACLERANLERANLEGAIFNRANLYYAKLNGANLSRIKLRGADLRSVDLRRSNLRSADLSGADLRNAKLKGADLRESDLEGANLNGANLNGADLEGANLNGANLNEADLEGTNLRRTILEGKEVIQIELPLK